MDKTKKIAVIGGGISGISVARMLQKKAQVVVFEGNDKIGGLIRCDDLPEGLYHKLGGHVFNTKSPAVADWFWSHFHKEKEFHRLNRDARILFGTSMVGYPLENHLYQLPEATIKSVIRDLIVKVARAETIEPANFKEALMRIFGKTLCETYFFPYNEKIWRTDLASIPTGWLEGKLPLPDVAEILESNVLRRPENTMVHAQFYYALRGGSQFIIDRLAEGLDIRLSTPISHLNRREGKWFINENIEEAYDQVVYTGDIRNLSGLLPELSAHPAMERISGLRTRGITNVFCECDPTTISWLYLPDCNLAANRIIYTGGFSSANNHSGRMTCVVEFVHGENEEVIERDIKMLPGNLRRIATNHVRDAYVIQEQATREKILCLKNYLEARNLYTVGRFADWEYYNIDKAIEAAMDLVKTIFSH
jgi:protoporphyrinogen oxidase